MNPERKLLIIGAGGQIASHVIGMLANDNVTLSLFLRHPAHLTEPLAPGTRVIRGDATDTRALIKTMQNQDLVYVNLAGPVDVQMKCIIDAMHASGVRRIVTISSLGIYDEVPGRFGEWNRREIGAYLGPYRRAADMLEASGLDYTIVRPAWLTDADEVDYETTRRNELFKGTEVSRRSVAALVAEIVRSPSRFSGENMGVNKPGTDADKPAFM